jgi:hypothetical protein
MWVTRMTEHTTEIEYKVSPSQGLTGPPLVSDPPLKVLTQTSPAQASQ